jgi:hypothetical protein
MCLLQRGGNHLPQTTVKDALPKANARRRRLPSLSVIIWIALFLGLTLSSARIVLISADSDAAWHRRFGDWMIEHHAIVRSDDFLHTQHGTIITRDWLSEVIYAAAARAFGWSGFALVAAALIATIFWLLHHQLLAEGCDVILATALVLAAMLACSVQWLARAFLFTHLLTLVFAWQLRWFQQGRIPTWRIFLLLPLMILWVNLHGAFVIGLMLLAMYASGSAIDALRRTSSWTQPMILGALLLLGAAASLVNPNGWRLHAQIFNFLQSHELAGITTGFASPNFHTVGPEGFSLLLFLLALVLLVVRPRLTTTEVLLVGGWGYFALLSARNIPIFALVVTPLLGQWITGFLKANQLAWWSRLYYQRVDRIPPTDPVANAVMVVAVIVCLTLVLAKPTIAGGPPLLVTDFPPDRYPTDVVGYLRNHPTAIRDEMFNHLDWGGYLEYAWPEQKPFIDSRFVFYGVDFTREFLTVNRANAGWELVFAKYHVGWTLLPPQHPLNQILRLDPGWQFVFSNYQAVVYSRRS